MSSALWVRLLGPHEGRGLSVDDRPVYGLGGFNHLFTRLENVACRFVDQTSYDTCPSYKLSINETNSFT